MRVIEIVDKKNGNKHLAYASSKWQADVMIHSDGTFGRLGDNSPICPVIREVNIYGLKEIRIFRGMSQGTLSRLSGVNVRTLQDYEQGKRSLLRANAYSVLQLARSLRVSMEDLLMEDACFVEPGDG